MDPGDGDAGLVGGFEEAVLEVTGHEAGAAAFIAAEDQGERFRAVAGVFDDGVEGPGLAGGAAGEEVEVADVDGARAMVALEEGGEGGGEFVGVIWVES